MGPERSGRQGAANTEPALTTTRKALFVMATAQNNTSRADARTMSSSRRALLGSILAVGAAASVPAAAAIASTGCADAELFALQPAIEAADRREDAALDAKSQAEAAYFAARPPKPVRPETS
jgi:hypothetical protein